MLLLPTWSIVHSRFWKAQIPYLARHLRVITFDGRGNGRSDRPAGADGVPASEFAADALAVLDATDTERAAAGRALLRRAVGDDRWPPTTPSGSTRIVLHRRRRSALGARHPERDVSRVRRARSTTDDGWAKYNRHYWQRDYGGFLEFFFAQCFSEPHSTKQIEDCIGWALETDPETLADATRGIGLSPRQEPFAETCARVRCPTLVIHGDERPDPPASHRVRRSREATGGAARDARGRRATSRSRATRCKVNLLMREFVGRRRAPPSALDARPSRGAGARSTSPRRSASATRGATSRSPTSCARSTPTSRSTGSRSTR